MIYTIFFELLILFNYINQTAKKVLYRGEMYAGKSYTACAIQD